MEKVLIVGANGTTGKQIVMKLKDSSKFEPVAMVRKEDQKAQFETENIQTILGDLEKDLTHVVKDVDRVVFAAGSGGGTSDEKTIVIDQESAKRLIDVSKLSGIKKFVMLSSIGAGHPEDSDSLQVYLKAKHLADEHLKASGLTYTIVRPGTLKNDDAVGKIETRDQFEEGGKISRADVAETLATVVSDDYAQNAIFEMIEGETPIKDALKAL